MTLCTFSVQDRFVEGEERWQTIGMVAGVVLIVAHAYVEAEEEIIRIISARRATTRERARYEEGE